MTLVKNASVLLAGNAVAQALQFACLPVLTRLADPAAFGSFALFIGVGTLVLQFAGLRYEVPIVIARSDRQAQILARLVRLICAISCGICLVVAPPALVLVGDVSVERSYQLTLLLCLFLVASNEYKIASAWLNRDARFDWLALSSLCASVGAISSQIALLRAGFEPSLALIAGYILGQTLGAIPCLLFRQHRPPCSTSTKALLAAARKYRDFPKYLLSFGLLTQSRDRIIQILVGAIAGAQAVGVFAMAQRIASAPYLFLYSGVGPVMLSYSRDRSKDSVGVTAAKLLQMSLLLMAPLFVVVGVNAESIFPLLLGPGWESVGRLIPYLLMPYLLLAGAAFVDRLFIIHGQQKSALVAELICSAGLFSAVAIGGFRGDVLSLTMSFSGVYFAFLCCWLAFAFSVNGLGVERLREVVIIAVLATAAQIGINLWFADLEPLLVRVVASLLTGLLAVFLILVGNGDFARARLLLSKGTAPLSPGHPKRLQ